MCVSVRIPSGDTFIGVSMLLSVFDAQQQNPGLVVYRFSLGLPFGSPLVVIVSCIPMLLLAPLPLDTGVRSRFSIPTHSSMRNTLVAMAVGLFVFVFACVGIATATAIFGILFLLPSFASDADSLTRLCVARGPSS